jgi:hypothetical protein
VSIFSNWDYACPLQVSFVEHCQAISVHLAQLLNATRFDGVLVLSPEVAAIVESHLRFRSIVTTWGKPGDWPLQIGVLCGRMPIWIDPFIPFDQARVYDEIDGKVLGTLQVYNIHGTNRGPLDFMAKIE